MVFASGGPIQDSNQRMCVSAVVPTVAESRTLPIICGQQGVDQTGLELELTLR